MEMTVSREPGRGWGGKVIAAPRAELELMETVVGWDVIQERIGKPLGDVRVAGNSGFDVCSGVMALGGAESAKNFCCREDWERGAYGKDWWIRAGAYAWMEANRKQILTPLECRARSVYLAAVRRRGLQEDDKEFRDEYKKWLGERQGHPVTDGFRLSTYSAELRLLSRDKEAYERDRRRAKTFAVFVMGRDGKRVVKEGILVKDPESVLFQDWAWRDVEQSKEKDGYGVAVVIREDCALIAADPLKKLDLTALRRELGSGWHRVNGESQVSDSVWGWWTLWGDGQRSVEEIEKRLREQCEGQMFPQGAVWKPGKAGKNVLQVVTAPVEIKCNKIQYYTCALDEQLGARLHKAAFDAVAEALWEVIRSDTDKRSGTPMDFGKHVQGDSGVVTVWSRDAFALAYSTAEGKALAGKLKRSLELMAGLRVLEDEAEEAAEDGDHSARLEDIEGKLFKNFSKLQTAMSQPGLRLLRKMFEATNQTEVHHARLDVHLAYEAKKQAEETTEIQKKLEFIELFIVLFYAYEFTHTVLQRPLESAAKAWLEQGKAGWGHSLEFAIPVIVAVVVAILYWFAKPFLLDSKGKTRGVKGDGPADRAETAGKEAAYAEEGKQEKEREKRRDRLQWAVIGVFFALLAMAFGLIWVGVSDNSKPGTAPGHGSSLTRPSEQRQEASEGPNKGPGGIEQPQTGTAQQKSAAGAESKKGH